MIGMDRATGMSLSGRAHLAQSIADILTTPIGSRVMRRDYGSALFELIDQAGNTQGRLRMYAATAMALSRWEPRVRLRRAAIDVAASGQCTIDLELEDLEAPDPNSLMRLSIPLNVRAVTPAN